MMKRHVKVPRTYRPPRGPVEHLAYLNPQEMDFLRRSTDGTVSRGPNGIPSLWFDGANDPPPKPTTSTSSVGGLLGSLFKPSDNKPSDANKADAKKADEAKKTEAAKAAATPVATGMSSGSYLASRYGAPSVADAVKATSTASNPPSGLRGITGPAGTPRMQPSSFGTSYQTAQMMRNAYPNVAARVSQPDLASGLNTFSGAMPGEAFVARNGPGAMNNIGRVGLNQIAAGVSPETMLGRMDTTGMGPRNTAEFSKPGTRSMGMQPPGSPYQTMAAGALQEALMGRGVSPQAMNASNFVAQGTPLPRGIAPMGAPVSGTQFGIDPAWRTRIANANAEAMGRPMTQMAATQPSPTARPALSQVQQASDLQAPGAEAAAFGLGYQPSPMEQDFAYLGGRVGPYVGPDGRVMPEAEAMAAMDPRFAKGLAQDMRAAEAATGQTGTIINAYRSPASQQRIHNEAAGQWPASKPGTSMHQYGQAVDVAPGAVRDWLRKEASAGRLASGSFPIRNDPGHLAYNGIKAPPRDVRAANAGLSPLGLGGPASDTYSPGAVAVALSGNPASPSQAPVQVAGPSMVAPSQYRPQPIPEPIGGSPTYGAPVTVAAMPVMPRGGFPSASVMPGPAPLTQTPSGYGYVATPPQMPLSTNRPSGGIPARQPAPGNMISETDPSLWDKIASGVQSGFQQAKTGVEKRIQEKIASAKKNPLGSALAYLDAKLKTSGGGNPFGAQMPMGSGGHANWKDQFGDDWDAYQASLKKKDKGGKKKTGKHPSLYALPHWNFPGGDLPWLPDAPKPIWWA